MDKLGVAGFGSGVLVGLGGANIAPQATFVGSLLVDPVSLSSPAGATPALKSFVVPAGALTLALGRGLRIRASGSFANNANAKTVVVKYGATTILTITATVSVANVWYFDVFVLVRTATSQICGGFGAQGAGTPTFVVADATAGETIANAITIAVSGTQTSAGDIVQDCLIVDYLQ